jgi:hydrogenase expression/formation protein HypC
MCLAVPGRIIECDSGEALVDFQGNRLKVSKLLTPEAAVGDWVLVHAGFAISTIEEKDALETWDYLRAISDERNPGGGAETAS